MNKELEALEAIGETFTDEKEIAPYKSLKLNTYKEYNIIKQALTPPTEEEMCEILTNIVGEKVSFCNDKNFSYMFYCGDDLWKTEEILISYNVRKGKIEFEGYWIYSPSVLEKIAKFYKGVVDKNG